MSDPIAAHKRLMAKLPVKTHTLMDDGHTFPWREHKGGIVNRKRIIVRGTEYESIRAASIAEELSITTIKRWIMLNNGTAKFK
jgi:hypothetical protein